VRIVALRSPGPMRPSFARMHQSERRIYYARSGSVTASCQRHCRRSVDLAYTTEFAEPRHRHGSVSNSLTPLDDSAMTVDTWAVTFSEGGATQWFASGRARFGPRTGDVTSRSAYLSPVRQFELRGVVRKLDWSLIRSRHAGDGHKRQTLDVQLCRGLRSPPRTPPQMPTSDVCLSALEGRTRSQRLLCEIWS